MICQWRLRSPKQVSINLWNSGWGIGESKRHPFALIEPQQSYCKCCQRFTLLIHLNLPVARFQIKGGKPTESLGGYQAFHQSGAVSRHPLQFIHLAFWGLYRTSGHHPFSEPTPLHWPTDCEIYGWPQYPTFLGYEPSHHVIQVGRYMHLYLSLKGDLVWWAWFYV